MGLFKKKDRVIDLSKKYKEQQARTDRISAAAGVSSESSNSEAAPFSGGFGIFGNANPSTTASSANSADESQSEGYVDFSSGEDDRKKRLAKRLMAMTDKLEDISNQIYHLQQRLEVLEKKIGVGGY